jgi:hypothetical protein
MIKGVYFKELIIIFLLLLISVPIDAANHYIRQGASGSANGSDWTNAWTDLPSTFTRGDTYYVADGTYGGHTFSTAASGTQYITIKKATADEHGTSTGWNSAYGDGQALFTTDPAAYTGVFNISSDYWQIDGVTRNESAWNDSTSYGFHIKVATGTAFEISTIWFKNGCDYVTVQYCNIEHAGMRTNKRHDALQCNESEVDGGFSYLTIARNYVHNTNRCFVLFNRTHYITFEYNEMAYMDDNSDPYIHREAWMSLRSDNWVVRYNIVHDLYGRTSPIGNMPTGIFVTLDSVQNNYWIYGNVFYNCWTSNGVVTNSTGDTTNNSLVYNNTFVNISGYCSGINADMGTGNIARNNVWYNCPRAPVWTHVGSGTTTYSHNYNAAPNNLLEANDVLITSNPFVAGTYKPHSSSQLLDMADTSVSSTYRTDRDGTLHDEIGALAYEESTPPEDEVDTWYVSSGATSGDGTISSPFGTLAELMADMGVSDNAVIAGEFNETITADADSETFAGWPDSTATLNFKAPLTDWSITYSAEGEVGEASIDTLQVLADAMLAADALDDFRTSQSNYITNNISAGDSFYVFLSVIMPTDLASIDSVKINLNSASTRTDWVTKISAYDDNSATPPSSVATAANMVNNQVSTLITWTTNITSGSSILSADVKSVLADISTTVSEGDTVTFVLWPPGKSFLSSYFDATELGTGYSKIIFYNSGVEAGHPLNAVKDLGYTPPIVWVNDIITDSEIAWKDSLESGEIYLNGDSLYVCLGDTTGIDIRSGYGFDIDSQVALELKSVRIKHTDVAIINDANDSIIRYVIADSVRTLSTGTAESFFNNITLIADTLDARGKQFYFCLIDVDEILTDGNTNIQYSAFRNQLPDGTGNIQDADYSLNSDYLPSDLPVPPTTYYGAVQYSDTEKLLTVSEIDSLYTYPSDFKLEWLSENIDSLLIALYNGIDLVQQVEVLTSLGSYTFSLTDSVDYGTDALFAEIYDLADSAYADTTITFGYRGTLEVTNPGSGNSWEEETYHTILFTRHKVEFVNVEYSLDAGETYTLLDNSLGIDTNLDWYGWTLPADSTTIGLVKVSDTYFTDVYDESTPYLTITLAPETPTGSITIQGISGTYYYGDDIPVRWTYSELTENVHARLYSGFTLLDSTTVAIGDTTLTLSPNTMITGTDAAYVIITCEGESSQSSNFSLRGIIDLTDPTGGEIWSDGSTHNIRWTGHGIGNVAIDYSSDGGFNWDSLTASTSNDGSYTWGISAAATTFGRIRIYDVTYTEIIDQSSNFEITVQTLRRRLKFLLPFLRL